MQIMNLVTVHKEKSLKMLELLTDRQERRRFPCERNNMNEKRLHSLFILTSSVIFTSLRVCVTLNSIEDVTFITTGQQFLICPCRKFGSLHYGVQSSDHILTIFPSPRLLVHLMMMMTVIDK